MKLVGKAVTALIISKERRQRTEQRNQNKVVNDITVATISAASPLSNLLDTAGFDECQRKYLSVLFSSSFGTFQFIKHPIIQAFQHPPQYPSNIKHPKFADSIGSNLKMPEVTRQTSTKDGSDEPSDHPNGFVTIREIDGQRVNMRIYNDGRISEPYLMEAGQYLAAELLPHGEGTLPRLVVAEWERTVRCQ